MITKITHIIAISLAITFTCTYNVIAREPDRHIETETLENINYQQEFISVGDMPYNFDSRTIVYDKNGQLLSLRQLKAGQVLELHIRPQTHNGMLLDKIVILK